MKEDDIVYLPWSLVHCVVPPNSSFGEALRKEFDGVLPYLELWPADTGIYARVIGIVTTPGSPEQTVVSFTTFPVSTGGVKLLCMVFPGRVELVTVTDPNILNAVTRNNAVDLNTLTDKGKSPTITVKRKTGKELLNETLDLVFPGQYGWGSAFNGEVPLYIHWPRITITNSKQQTRQIYGLVVRLWFNDNYRYMTRNVEGKRIGLTTSDLESGYRHSHLPVGVNDYSSFCLGHSSMSNMMIDGMSNCPPDWFYVFLIHLDQYVRWESLEGGPYIRISDVKNRVSVPIRPENIVIRQDTIDFVVSWVLPKLTPALIQREVFPDNSVRYKLNTYGNAGLALKELINEYWPESQRLNYSNETGQYLQLGHTASNTLQSMISSHLTRSGIRTPELNISSSYVNEDATTDTSVVRVAPPTGYLHVILDIENLLNNKVPIQFAQYYEVHGASPEKVATVDEVPLPF